jgi:hypothetical protein
LYSIETSKSIKRTGSIWRRQSQQSFNTLTPFNFLFYSLHVSAPTGHPQVRYTITISVFEGLFQYNGSVARTQFYYRDVIRCHRFSKSKNKLSKELTFPFASLEFTCTGKNNKTYSSRFLVSEPGMPTARTLFVNHGFLHNFAWIIYSKMIGLLASNEVGGARDYSGDYRMWPWGLLSL